MARKYGRFVALGLAVAAAGGLGYRALRPKQVQTSRVARGTSVSAVYASGAVEPVDRVDVSARVAGPIAELLVREGDAVKKGDVLARIDATALDFDVARAKAESIGASRRLASAPGIESLRAQREALAAQLTEARGDLARVERLGKSGSISAAEVDRAKTRVDALEAQIAANQAQEKELRIALQTDAMRQQALLGSSKTRADDADVRSPLDGTVLSRRVEPGQVVAPNQVLFRVGDLSRLHLEVDIDEADIGRVRVGMPAAVRLYARRDEAIAAHVAKIRPEADRNKKSFHVEIDFDGKPEGLLTGMSAEVNVVVSKHDGVLLAPLEAIRDGKLWVVEGDRARLRPVTIVQRGLLYAEVEGVDEGARVIVGDTSALVEGDRVSGTEAKLPAPEGAASEKHAASQPGG